MIVGVCRYPVYHSTPLELGDIAMGKKNFFPPNLSPICNIALMGWCRWILAKFIQLRRHFYRLATDHTPRITPEMNELGSLVYLDNRFCYATSSDEKVTVPPSPSVNHDFGCLGTLLSVWAFCHVHTTKNPAAGFVRVLSYTFSDSRTDSCRLVGFHRR